MLATLYIRRADSCQAGRILYQIYMDAPMEEAEIFLNKKENQQIQIIYPMNSAASDKQLILREE